MFVKYPMVNGTDYRGRVFHIAMDQQGNEMAYSRVNSVDNDMVVLTGTELTNKVHQYRRSLGTSPYRGKLILDQYGLLEQATTLADNPASPASMRIAFYSSQRWERLSSFIEAFAAELELSEEMTDALFEAANDLEGL